MTAAVRDLLVVVEYEDELPADCFQVAQNSRDDRIDDIRARLPERTHGVGTPFGYSVPDRLNDVAPERDRVVVPRVERDAGEGAAIDLPPLREEGRLAEPRRRSKQDEPRPRLAQHVRAAGTGESVARGANPLELPFEEDAIVGETTGEPVGSCRGCGHGDVTSRLRSARFDLLGAISVAHEGSRGNGGLHGTFGEACAWGACTPERCKERRGPQPAENFTRVNTIGR